MKRIFLILSAFLFLISTASATETTFTRHDMLADMDSLYAAVYEIHPDMFAYLPKEEFEKHLEAAKKELKDDMDIFEFHNVAARLLSKLGDGHTSAYFPLRSLTQAHIKLFPFSVEVNYRDSGVYIRNDFSEPKSGIPSGAEIISINGRDIKKITGEMLECRSGEKLFFRAASLNSNFTQLLYSLYADTVFTIDYKTDDMIMQRTVSGLGYFERFRPLNSNQPLRANYSLEIDREKKIATIQFIQFHDIDRFRLFIDSAFTVIKNENINDLIIDIRRNGGGRSDIGDEFFQYISPVPFHQFGGGLIKVSDRMKKSRFEDFGYVIEDEIGIRPMREGSLIELRNNPLRFTGNTYLLTSHFTFSSAGSFSWAFRYFNMGTIIGEETGGLAVCFGDVVPQTLSNTGLMFGVSYKKFYQWGATDENIHGTIPHYEIEAGKAMDFAIEMILNNRI